jgi:hypothetical protein
MRWVDWLSRGYISMWSTSDELHASLVMELREMEESFKIPVST